MANTISFHQHTCPICGHQFSSRAYQDEFDKNSEVCQTVCKPLAKAMRIVCGEEKDGFVKVAGQAKRQRVKTEPKLSKLVRVMQAEGRGDMAATVMADIKGRLFSAANTANQAGKLARCSNPRPYTDKKRSGWRGNKDNSPLAKRWKKLRSRQRKQAKANLAALAATLTPEQAAILTSNLAVLTTVRKQRPSESTMDKMQAALDSASTTIPAFIEE
jgi:hypothetical protein